MQNSWWSLTLWRRRRLILLLVFQCIGLALVVSVLQQLSTDSDGWMLRNPLDAMVGWDMDAKGQGRGRTSLPFGDGLRDLNRMQIETAGGDEVLVKAGGVFSFIPHYNDLSMRLEGQNHDPPRNLDLFPKLTENHITIVLYVHNRPQYLRLVVHSLSQVKGIEETLLVVSHDGFFPEMNAIIEGIRFCQVKQIFAPFSPHLFPNSFPGQAPDDCKDKEDPVVSGCRGNPDHYGNHRSPRIVSLKHHWWWMMNTVWDGLAETRYTSGHMLFIEEDHFLLPNAYRTIQELSRIVGAKCPECVAVNLAPVDVNSQGELNEVLVIEKIGNMGYAFNRTVWDWIHAMAKPFCIFDDYNWDITMWAAVYPSFPTEGYTLRGPRSSAIHFGKCGLHQGQDKSNGLCVDDQKQLPSASAEDSLLHISPDWHVAKYPIRGYNKGFDGWGGWADKRDQQLCQNFSTMYRRSPAI